MCCGPLQDRCKYFFQVRSPVIGERQTLIDERDVMKQPVML